MVYSDFNLAKVRDAFGLTLEESHDLFAVVAPIAPSDTLKTILADYISLATAIATEKARSEFLIAPILAEVRRQFNNQISLFSGSEFSVDPAQGLQGFCDYIISAAREQLLITAPVMIIVEAKREDIIGGADGTVSVDRVEYYINQIDKILGILMNPFQPSFATILG